MEGGESQNKNRTNEEGRVETGVQEEDKKKDED